MNKDFYKNIEYVKNPNDITVLVNKSNKLTSDFIPNDLETLELKCSNEGKLVKSEVKYNFEKLCNDAREYNYQIVAISAFRNYDYQNELYNYYVNTKGEEYADSASARPGHSEHQTGLAIDVMGSNNDYDLFSDSIEFEWMKNNAHKYGFILRYPEGKEHITGFKYEPWHYRYVGKEIAEIIYNDNLTFEEYHKLYLKKD